MKQEKFKLRDWQTRAYEYFKDNPNCIMECATGTGKTFQSIYMIKQLMKKHPYMKFLIVAPKNVIIEQAWMEDMHKFGIPLNKIGLYNGFTREFSTITMISIQSMKQLLNSEIYDMFDCVIFDEVHNYGTDNYLKLLRIPKQYKIGLTATLERQDMKHILIKQCFNDKIFKYSIEDALKDKVLNPFEFYHLSITMDEETKEKYIILSEKIEWISKEIGIKDFSKLKVDIESHAMLLKILNDRKKLITNYSQKSVVTKSIIRQNRDKKILVFNQFNLSSKALFWELQDINIRCDIMNSDINSELQSKIFRKFEGDELDVLLATTMLDEGYNLPKIEVAILMAQNSTEKQFIQRMGRVLRKKDKPSKVYYITVQDTFEEKYFLNKQERIKNIAAKYTEIVL